MRNFAAALAALCLTLTFAHVAPAATIQATPASLPTALKAAADGDVILLDGGMYGDMTFSRTFTAGLVIRSAERAAPAIFNQVAFKAAKGVTLDGVVIRYQPTATSTYMTPALSIDAAERITVRNSDISAGPAVNGVDETASALDASGNIKGWPAGRAVQIMGSSDIRLEANRLHHTDRGIVLSKGVRVAIVGNEVDSLRRSAIVGSADDLLIERNYLHGSKPWRWGQTPTGDHAEFMLLFPPSGARLKGVIIRGNVTANSTGIDILGLNGGSVDGLVYEDNVITGTDHQGAVWTDAPGAIIRRNVLLGRAQLMIRAGTTGSQVTDNLAAGIYFSPSGLTVDQLAALKASTNLTGTRFVQYAAPTKPGYIAPAALADLVAKAPKRTPQETYAATLAAAGYAPAPAPPPGPADPRDATIAALKVQVTTLEAQLARQAMDAAAELATAKASADQALQAERDLHDQAAALAGEYRRVLEAIAGDVGLALAANP
jgi:hypothetical protein